MYAGHGATPRNNDEIGYWYTALSCRAWTPGDAVRGRERVMAALAQLQSCSPPTYDDTDEERPEMLVLGALVPGLVGSPLLGHLLFWAMFGSAFLLHQALVAVDFMVGLVPSLV